MSPLPQIQQVDIATPIQNYYAAKQRNQQLDQQGRMQNQQMQMNQMQMDQMKKQAPLRDFREKLNSLKDNQELAKIGMNQILTLDTSAEDFDKQAMESINSYVEELQGYGFSEKEAVLVGQRIVSSGGMTKDVIKALQTRMRKDLGLDAGKEIEKVVDAGNRQVVIYADGTEKEIFKGGKDDPQTTLGKLIKERDALPKDSEDRKLFDARIADYVAGNAESITLSKDGTFTMTKGAPGKSGGLKLSTDYRLKEGGKEAEAVPGTPAAQKLEAEKAAKIQAQTNIISKADLVVEDIGKALESVSGITTTGAIGKASSLVPATPAYDLNQTIDAIKANIGFDALQKMRDASPTGGALGQVSERELSQLERVLGSLDIGQSKEQLRENLIRARLHYNNWKNTVIESRGEQTVPTGPPPGATHQGINPETKRMEYFDAQGNKL